MIRYLFQGQINKERQKSKGKCEVCLELQRFWDLNRWAAHENLGTPKKVVLTSNCDVHKGLLEECFPQFWNNWSRVKSISIRYNSNSQASINLTNKDGYNNLYESHCNLELVQGAGKKRKVGKGRLHLKFDWRGIEGGLTTQSGPPEAGHTKKVSFP
jgi:hypothetical protein